MPAPMQRLTPGEPLAISASTFNTMVDAAQIVHSQGHHVGGGQPASVPLEPGRIRVRNTSGEGRNRGEILGIDGPAISPATNENQFASEVIVDGVVPTEAHAGRFVVLLEPIRDGGIGRAIVTGAVPVKVQLVGNHLDDADPDRFAEVIEGDVTRLRSGTTGSAQILWMEDDDEAESDTLWAVVRLNNLPAESDLEPETPNFAVYGELDDELVAGGSATLSLNNEEGDLELDVTVYDNLMGEGQTLPAGTLVWAIWHTLDEKWYLFASKRCPDGSWEGGGGGVTDHGELDGLGDDDHTIYSLADGSRWTLTQTANRVVISDASGNLVVSAITSTELAALDNITGNIQTRLNALENATYIAGRVIVSDGAGHLATSAITSTELAALDNITGNIEERLDELESATPGGFDPDRVIVSDGDGDLEASSITTTELGYLDGVSSNIQTQLDGKSNTGHGHDIEDIDGLEDALAGKSNTGHGHDIEDIDGLEDALAGKAASSHGHAIADVTGLQSALDSKANDGHGHAIADVTGLQTSLDAIDDALAAALTKAVDTVTTSGSLTTANRTVLANNSSAAITLDLPPAATMAGDYLIVKKISNNAHTVTLDPNGTETVDGASTYVLYVVGDYVIIQSDGSNWRVIGGYLTPHTASVYMSVPVECQNATFTRMPFNAAAFDVGGLADITTDHRIEIKRAGKYDIKAVFRLVESTEIQVAQCHVYKNGTTAVPSNLFQPAVFSGLYSVRVQLVGALDLAAGDYLDLYGHQINSLGNSYYTLTTTEGRPTLTVTEVR